MPQQPKFAVYAIRVEGHLSSQWADWFDGMDITLLDDGVTLLSGPVVDQAALYRLLRTIHDLGMPLLSIVRMDSHSHCSTQGDQP